MGLDYGLFNRLTGSVDLYKRTTKDLLLNTSTLLSLVFKDNYNVGNIEHKVVLAELSPFVL
jgi:iron complex outermembrane receptor protein